MLRESGPIVATAQMIAIDAGYRRVNLSRGNHLGTDHTRQIINGAIVEGWIPVRINNQDFLETPFGMLSALFSANQYAEEDMVAVHLWKYSDEAAGIWTYVTPMEEVVDQARTYLNALDIPPTVMARQLIDAALDHPERFGRLQIRGLDSAALRIAGQLLRTQPE